MVEKSMANEKEEEEERAERVVNNSIELKIKHLEKITAEYKSERAVLEEQRDSINFQLEFIDLEVKRKIANEIITIGLERTKSTNKKGEISNES